MKDDQIYKDRRYRINELREKNEKLTSRERTSKAINLEEVFIKATGTQPFELGEVE